MTLVLLIGCYLLELCNKMKSNLKSKNLKQDLNIKEERYRGYFFPIVGDVLSGCGRKNRAGPKRLSPIVDFFSQF